MIGLIRAHDLDGWAARIVTPPEFPRLVRRLVYATGKGLTNVDFPADEAIRRAGFDGKVIATEATPNIPEGFSVWELGTGGDPKAKANDDYVKRTYPRKEDTEPKKECVDVNRSEATFVFVTLRNWPGKEEWAKEKRNEKIWRDVRALDAEDVTQWLESAPGVAAWLGPVVGQVPEDARGLEAECESYRLSTQPTFDLQGLLISRDAARKKLLERLHSSARTLEISATTVLEGVAFVGACVDALPEDERESLLSRSIWVESNRGMRLLMAANRPLVILSAGDLQVLPTQHHRIVVKTINAGSSETIELGAQQITPLVDYLGKLGMDTNDAYRRCREANGYLERVRHTALIVVPTPPSWAAAPAAVEVAVTVLVGGWDEANEADRALVANIAGTDYETLTRAITPFLTGPSPLMSHAGTIWKVYARSTAWKFLESSLTSKQWNSFLTQTVEVLLEDDPMFESTAAEGWEANFKHNARIHSNGLRSGLAGGLLHAAALGRSDSACYAGRRPQSCVDGACRELCKKRDEPTFWRRIRDEMEELAEASPEEFLSALEADLRLPSIQFRQLFEYEGAHGTGLQSHLLWALEILGWSPEYVGRAALALAGLHEIDPGSRNGNHPFESLRGMMLPCDPQCCLAAVDRAALLSAVGKRYPSTGWSLGCALVPSVTMSWVPSCRPALRSWSTVEHKAVLWADYWREVGGIATKLLESAGDNPGRWEFLLSHLGSFDAPLRERAIAEAEVAALGLSGDRRTSMWQALRRLLHNHNQFDQHNNGPEKKADWVYERAIIDRIQRIYQAMTPADPIDRYAWLFCDGAVRPMNISLDWQEEQARLRADRAEAIKELTALELSELIGALPRFQNQWQFGLSLGESDQSHEIESELLRTYCNSGIQMERDFARGFAVARYMQAPGEFSPRWCKVESRDFLSARGVATVCGALPPTQELWDVVDAAGEACTRLYWEEAPVHFLKRPLDSERAARNLLKVSKPLEGIALLAMNLETEWLSKEGDIALALDCLREGIGAINANPSRGENVVYQIASLIKKLVDSQRLQRGEIMHLEWMYFGALEYHGQHKLVIYEHLLSDPALFLQLVGLLYRREDLPKGEGPPPTDGEQSVATQVWRLFNHWAPFKATAAEDMPTAEKLGAHIEACRALAATEHHVEAVDDLLGTALSSSPPGADGLWPHESVRDVLERYEHVEKLVQGFVTGKLNLRGVTSRRPGDGGEQERDLAASYSEWQKALAITHPYASRLLGILAEHYRSDGAFHDVLHRQ